MSFEFNVCSVLSWHAYVAVIPEVISVELVDMAIEVPYFDMVE